MPISQGFVYLNLTDWTVKIKFDDKLSSGVEVKIFIYIDEHNFEVLKLLTAV